MDVRNAALKMARGAAPACCENPRIANVSDWLAGYGAWKVSFECEQG